MSISFFAREAFLNTNPGEPLRIRTKPITSGHIMRVSSLIRGDQIAEFMGARFNPENGYEDDICIYVKPMVRKGEDFKFEGRKAYLDIIDGHNLAEVAKRHPEVGVIVCSEADKQIMSRELPQNDIVLIPQQHCNFERVKRTRTEVAKVGVIGTKGAFPYLPRELRGELEKRGMELIEFSSFFTREDIVDFYLNIDIQVVWRPYKKILSNPLKIINASSFGVPTIALDEKAFWELKGIYIPVGNVKTLIDAIDKLRNDSQLYADYSLRCIERSEDYHIGKIAELYKQLDA